MLGSHTLPNSHFNSGQVEGSHHQKVHMHGIGSGFAQQMPLQPAQFWALHARRNLEWLQTCVNNMSSE